MASIVDALIATVFAPVCLSCARVLDAPTRSPVCDTCWARIGRFATPACDLGSLSTTLSHVRAVGPFDDVLRDVVHGLKFQGRRTLAARLGSAAAWRRRRAARRRRRGRARPSASLASVAPDLQSGRPARGDAGPSRVARASSAPRDAAANRAGRCTPVRPTCGMRLRWEGGCPAPPTARGGRLKAARWCSSTTCSRPARRWMRAHGCWSTGAHAK